MNIQLNLSGKRKRKRKVGTAAFSAGSVTADERQLKEKIIKIEEPASVKTNQLDETNSEYVPHDSALNVEAVSQVDKQKVMSQVLQSLMAKSRKRQQYGTDEKSSFMAEVLECPTELNADDEKVYEDMPIEDFGRAMLRGMGWVPQKNTKECSYEIKVRPERLGLGATPLENIIDKKQSTNAPMPTKLHITAKAVTAPIVSSIHPAFSSESDSGWLLAGIRVRVNSDKFLGGKYYAHKGLVTRVRGRLCTVLMDSDGTIQNELNEQFLNTALPKRGGTVAVLRGKHRGRIGKLILRDKHQKVAHVQFVDGSRKERKFRYDDVAEYVSGQH